MKVLITDYDFPDVDLELALYKAAGVEVVTAQCRTEEEVIAASAGCQGLLVQYAPVNAKVFAARPEIRIASRYGAGFDTINTEDAAKYGVWVGNSPDYGVGEVATHALAMALDLIRNITVYDRAVKAGEWHYTTAGIIPRASEMTLGIIGLGRIGKRMAHISRNVFKRVIAYDPHIIDGDFPAYVERVGREELFRQADVVSLHTPLNDETRGMIDASVLNLLKPNSYLVNSARGGLVNIDDLLAALDSNRLKGAALDVLPVEPPATASAIVQHKRVLLSPHAAFYSDVAACELRRKAAQNLIDWDRTGRPSYVVVEGKKDNKK
ncbi:MULTISPECIES: C-terminal binding protein [unclassified Herbaspirillum]|uniref:C-terminal binding protein n=1 Tax=unclassified Herbaspirillum TaxID=2624150 RepID=UPI0011500000|nr:MULTISPECIES: C-terminal binding protein [unclassified Herbaspirillum]MBB5391867.1 D-3-phosphoglycerate dehydrogenase [Herbaspirillum sp. SJZ102]TQK13327.1 D-3-phosphoglycerate dehydrogenase [Herbaspirillum sp. SJZ130]TQK15331.1 D-3-phosphoglycerate dehydrogenase [Herbaspirillum sp. SJZ106]